MCRRQFLIYLENSNQTCNNMFIKIIESNLIVTS
jgi:hypothetical protein